VKLATDRLITQLHLRVESAKAGHDMKYEQFDFESKVLHHQEHIQRYLDGQHPIPLNIEIDLTNACNHRCSFCVWATYIGEVRATLPLGIVISTLDELKALGTKSINWTGGGEPVLYKGFYEALDYSYQLGLENGLITNFSLIREEHDDQILEQLLWARVSMAGGLREQYREIQGVDDFDKVIANLKCISEKRRVRRSKLTLGIAMLVKPGNLHSVPDMVELASDIGLDYLQLREDMFISPPEKAWWKKQVIPVFNRAEKRAEEIGLKLLGAKYIDTQEYLNLPSKCHAHHFVLGINAEGYVAFCKNTRDNPDFYIGDLRKETFSNIWEESLKKREMESSINPISCATFCKNMGINKAIEDVVQCNITLPLVDPEPPVHVNFL
jgi:MoaA/NifB/PqqE/SkfB family radical SAM enzyme